MVNWQLFLEPINQVIASFLTAIPGIIYATIIITLGWMVAKIISAITKKFLRKVIKLDRWLEKHSLHDVIGDVNAVNLTAGLMFWWIMIIFLGQAALQLRLDLIGDVLREFILWTPNIIYGLLIFVGGLYLADFLGDKVKKSKTEWANRFAMILEPTVVFLVGLISLTQLGVDISLFSDLVRILVGTLSLGIALAIGLAFGLGMKDETPKMWKNFNKKWRKKNK